MPRYPRENMPTTSVGMAPNTPCVIVSNPREEIRLRNIELKARLADIDAARTKAQEITTKGLCPQHQTDTYFHCREGRLKLRQIDGISSQLIWYARADREGPKVSVYQLVPISNPETLKAALASALGIRCVVEKRREILLVDNVRIHLDDVVGLGTFLEFEAVLADETQDAADRTRLNELAAYFGIAPVDLLAVSYADMMS